MQRFFVLATLLASLLGLETVPSRAQTGEVGKADGQVLIDTDFGAEGAERAEQVSARVSGSLPSPWRDTSDWAPVSTNYRRGADGNRGFQRVSVERLEGGQAQMVHLLPDFDRPQLLSLDMTLRGTRELPFSFGIRQQGEPYHYLWRRQITPDSDWQDLHTTFQVPAGTQPMLFILETAAVGHLDLSRLRLRRTSPEAATREWREGHAKEGRNLLSASRLPSGLPSGWWFHPALWDWGTFGASTLPTDPEAKAETDQGSIGPSGAPSLRLTAPRGFGLFSAPFAVPLPFGAHTASFYVRGQGRGSCVVWGDGKELGRRDFDGQGGDWQRQEIAFQPDPGVQVYALRWQGAGTLWLDGLQVEPGQTATPLLPGLPAEVALSSTSASGAPPLVQFSEDEAIARWCVTGRSPDAPGLGGMRLRLQVVNPYGDTAPLPAVPLGAAFLQRGEVRFDAFPLRSLGLFRVEAWVENNDGQRISRTSEIVVNRLHRPRFWGQDAPDSPFGTHLLPLERDIAMAKAIGINWTRLHDQGTDLLGWAYLEPQPGNWQFRDADLGRYRQGHLKILGVLQTAPAWASALQTPHDPVFDRYYAPRDPAQFGAYVATVAARYKDTIDSYEVWSEPWNAPFYHTSHDGVAYRAGANPQADYARLMREAAQNARAVAPDVSILGFNTTTVEAIPGERIGGTQWTRGVLQNDGLKNSDVISYHHYMRGAEAGPGNEKMQAAVEEGFATALGPLRAESLENGAPKPVWLSEGSPITELSREAGFYQHTLPFPSGEAFTMPSDRMCRFVVGLLSQNVQKVFLYSMHAGNFFGQPNEYGLLMHRDGSLHPTGVAFSQLAWQLDGTRFKRTLSLGKNVLGHGFEGKGRSVIAVAATSQNARYALPRAALRALGADVTDLWGNPLPDAAEVGGTLVYLSSDQPLSALERVLKNAPAK